MKGIKKAVRKIKLQALYGRAEKGLITPYRDPQKSQSLFIRALGVLLKWLN